MRSKTKQKKNKYLSICLGLLPLEERRMRHKSTELMQVIPRRSLLQDFILRESLQFPIMRTTAEVFQLLCLDRFRFLRDKE